MNKQMQNGLDRRAALDVCLFRLIRTENELRTLAILFEHLRDSAYTAEDLKGTSVTLDRIGASIKKAVKIIDRIY